MANPDFRLHPSAPDSAPNTAPDCGDHPTLPIADRNGVSYCFNCIIVGCQAQAYNLACRMLNDRHLAEDAVQDSLTAAYRAFHQFRGDNLRAWLMRIVANNCRDMLRAARSRPSVPLDPTAPDPDSPESVLAAANIASAAESPEDYAERRELGQAIEAGFAALSEERRTALLLVDVQGFSYEETAAILNCSVGTVKSRISRGRRELRDFLRAAGELIPARFRQES